MSKTVKKCPICEKSTLNPLYDNLVICDTCELAISKKIPSDEEINSIYQQDYYFGKEYFDYKADRPALEYNFKKRIKSLSRSLHKDAYIVELGSAYGYFLNLIKDKVKRHIGFEVSTDGVKYSRAEFGIKVTNENFLNYKFKKNEVDMVLMWDVIEHLTTPEKYIEKSAYILKKDGILALTTGDISSPIAKLRKNKWRMIHPPTHLYYFNRKNIIKLLKKYGLTVQSIHYHSTSRNLGSVANQIICNRIALGKSIRVFQTGYRLAERTRLSKINLPVNTWDIMEVIAKK